MVVPANHEPRTSVQGPQPSSPVQAPAPQGGSRLFTDDQTSNQLSQGALNAIRAASELANHISPPPGQPVPDPTPAARTPSPLPQGRTPTGGVYHHHHYGRQPSLFDTWSFQRPVQNVYVGGAAREEQREEDHTLLAIISGLAFAALSFLGGKAYAEWKTCSAHHERALSFLKMIEGEAPISEQRQGHENIKEICKLHVDLSKGRRDKARNDLMLLIAGIAVTTLIAYGCIFRSAMARKVGLISLFPIGGCALWRIGMSCNDVSEKQLAEQIQELARQYLPDSQGEEAAID